MTTEIITYIAAPIVTASIAGVGWFAKYLVEKKDEEQKKREAQKEEEKRVEIAERNRQRQEIKDNIEELKTEVKQTKHEVRVLQAKIMTCKHEDCPNKLLLAQEWEQEKI